MSIQLRSPAGLRQRWGQRLSPAQGKGLLILPKGSRPTTASSAGPGGRWCLQEPVAQFGLGSIGGCLGGCRSKEVGSVLALAKGGEGAWLPKPDGLDAELLNYEY